MNSNFIKTEVIACCDGQLIDISQVNDDMFSQKIIGDGFAIIPSSNIITSPIDGNVTMIAPTLHAFGIRDVNGLEFLVHIGIDTVTLNGMGFELLIDKHANVKAGTPIIRVNLKEILVNELDPVVMCVLTSRLIKPSKVQIDSNRNVKSGDSVCWIEYTKE